MRALLRKDRPWLLLAAGLGTLAHLLVQAENGFESVWMFPIAKYAEKSALFFWFAASALGLAAVLAEEVTGTREYLLHRPVAAPRLFWGRMLGCTLVISCWSVVVPTLHLAMAHVIRPDSALIEDARYWGFLAEGPRGMLVFAQAVFLATAARRLLWALLAVSGCSLLLFRLIVDGLKNDQPWPLWILAVATAVLLLAAERAHREPRDLNRPWASARVALAAPTLVVLVALGASALCHKVQREGRTALLQRYPDIVRKGNDFQLVAWRGGEPSAVSDDHRMMGGLAAGPTPPTVWSSGAGLWKHEVSRSTAAGEGLTRPADPSYRFPGSAWTYRGLRYRRVEASPGSAVYLGSDGYVHVWRRSPQGQGRAPALRLRLGRDGAPFSAGTLVLAGGQGGLLLGDPVNRTLWAWQGAAAEPRLERVSLPGDDRPLLLPTDEPTWWNGSGAVTGERGAYLWRGDDFLPLPSEARAPSPATGRWLERRGPFSYQVGFLDRDGKQLFQHLYTPRTAEETTLAHLLEGLSLLRAPVITAASLAFAPEQPAQGASPGRGTVMFLDPLIPLGASWLVWASALVALLAAAGVHLRLLRLALPAPRRWLWTALVLTGGVPAAACALLVESRRNWSPMVAQSAPAPRPILLVPNV